MLLALDEKLLVVKVAVIRRNPIIAPHVFGLGHFLARNQRLIQLFAMPSTYDLYRVISGKKLLERLS
ncbi:hypothetical protein D3C76_1809610 [compost metagenome]